MIDLRKEQADLDRVSDALIVRFFDRLKPGDEARTAFDYWKECFEQARLHADQQWLTDKAESAMGELIPHMKPNPFDEVRDAVKAAPNNPDAGTGWLAHAHALEGRFTDEPR